MSLHGPCSEIVSKFQNFLLCTKRELGISVDKTIFIKKLLECTSFPNEKPPLHLFVSAERKETKQNTKIVSLNPVHSVNKC